MRPSQITAVAIAAFFTVTSSALAQTPPTQPPTQPPPTQTPPAQTQPAETKSGDTAATQTFAGCLMTEREYRSAHKLGEGQVGGVGLGDEYVLVDVKVSPAKAAPATAAPTGTPAASASATATSKCADQGTAYRLTGSDEEQLRTLVGRQVEIQGRFKNAEGAAAAGTRPDEKLPAEVEMLSFSEVPAPASTMDPPSPRLPVQGVPPPPTSPTVDLARGETPASTTARRELPATASSTGLVALIGVLALSSGLALTIIRRRIL